MSLLRSLCQTLVAAEKMLELLEGISGIALVGIFCLHGVVLVVVLLFPLGSKSI